MGGTDSPAGDPRVRRFEPGDGERVVGLHERALREAGTDPADVPGTDDLEDVESAYLDSGGEFLVVEIEADGGDSGTAVEIVAMGALAVEGEDLAPGEGELFRIAVDPDHQRRGYGTAILDGLERAARERGLDRIVLTTARRQQAATEFYPAHGYEQTGTERVGEYELLRFAKGLD